MPLVAQVAHNRDTNATSLISYKLEDRVLYVMLCHIFQVVYVSLS